MIDCLLSSSRREIQMASQIKGLIVPIGGWADIGPTCAYAFKQLPDNPT